MLPLTQLPSGPQLRRSSAVSRGRWPAHTWRRSQFVLLLVSGLLCCGCAPGAGEARFRLERVKGTPVIDAGGDSYRMDWGGKLTYIWRRQREEREPHPERWEGASLDDLPVRVEESIRQQVHGLVIHAYLSPAAPRGWHRCLALTVMRPATGQPRAGGGSGGPQWMAELFDLHTSERLAELDLGRMFDSLYYEQPEQGFRAEVRSAFAGPSGGIGLLLWFAQSGTFYLDGGIWDGKNWTPLMCIQPPGDAVQEQTIYVGPGNASVLQTSYGLFFSGPDGRLRKMWVLKGNVIAMLKQSVLVGMLKALLLAFVAGLATVSVLGLIWQAIGRRRHVALR
jgi:hypothetical protein